MRAKLLAEKLLVLATVFAFVVLRPVQGLMRRYSLVGDATFFDPSDFEWMGRIEEEWLAVRGELDRVLQHTDDLPNFQDIAAENRALTDDDRWKTFFFAAWGIPFPSNCARCPATAALLARIPGMKSAFFSILMPRKHLPPHRGPFAGVLRYHLGLMVPAGESCRIRVGNEFAQWREGKGLLFDDTYEHEVWNDTDEVRVVLFVDVERPLPFPLAQINRFAMWLIAHSSLVQPGIEKYADWEKRLERVWGTTLA